MSLGKLLESAFKTIGVNVTAGKVAASEVASSLPDIPVDITMLKTLAGSMKSNAEVQGVQLKISNLMNNFVASDETLKAAVAKNQGAPVFSPSLMNRIDDGSKIDLLSHELQNLVSSIPGNKSIIKDGQNMNLIDYVTYGVNNARAAYTAGTPVKAHMLLSDLTTEVAAVANFRKKALYGAIAENSKTAEGNVKAFVFGNVYTAVDKLTGIFTRAGMDTSVDMLKKANSTLKISRAAEQILVSKSRDVSNYVKQIASPETKTELETWIKAFVTGIDETGAPVKATFAAEGTELRSVQDSISQLLNLTYKGYDYSNPKDSVSNIVYKLYNTGRSFGNNGYGLSPDIDLKDQLGVSGFLRLRTDFNGISSGEGSVVEKLVEILGRKSGFAMSRAAQNEARFYINTAKNYAAPADYAFSVGESINKNAVDNYFNILDKKFKDISVNTDKEQSGFFGQLLNSAFSLSASSALSLSLKLHLMTWTQPFSQNGFDTFSNVVNGITGTVSGKKGDRTGYALKSFFPILWKSTRGKTEGMSAADIVSQTVPRFKELQEAYKKDGISALKTQEDILLFNSFREADFYSGSGMVDNLFINKIDFSQYGALGGGLLKKMDWASEKISNIFAANEKATRVTYFNMEYWKAADVIQSNLDSFLKSGKELTAEAKLETTQNIFKDLKTVRFKDIDKLDMEQQISDIFDSYVKNPGLKNTVAYNEQLTRASSTYATSIVDQTLFDYSALSAPGMLQSLKANMPILSPALMFMSYNFHALQMFSQIPKFIAAKDYKSLSQAVVTAAGYYAVGSALSSSKDETSQSWGNYLKTHTPGLSTVVGLPSMLYKPMGGLAAGPISTLMYLPVMGMEAVGDLTKGTNFEGLDPMTAYEFKEFRKQVFKNSKSNPVYNKGKDFLELLNVIEPE